MEKKKVLQKIPVNSTLPLLGIRTFLGQFLHIVLTIYTWGINIEFF